MFTHIIFFKLKNKNQTIEARNLLLSMEGKISELKEIEVGIDVVHSERSYDLALITRFETFEDMNTYAVHEYHVNEVIKYLKPMLESSKSVDYES
ncbi:Dabb family protein [Clostridium lacusfryxellense]|uniref:Dabb family protein n=1 Tax=Clostridium lacusfryxellense TaxID=205328 RepID=UPI001C0DC789|nr:Dabb family protein [Clostridium lacusfryxellense]MBU3113374.1 Dabb family protein [Clostridium lacusfryxellense]